MSAQTRSYLKQAVHHHKATSRRGMLERLFTMWFRGFVYNQIWEDPRVDAAGLKLGPHSKLLTISSGGCNVLNYLQHDPAKIIAVDLNHAHMCLTRLKLAGVAHLPDYETFYSFFGIGTDKRNLELYEQHLRPHLDADTRRFWESRAYLGGRIGRRRIAYFSQGFYNYAKLGRFLKFAHRMGRLTRKDPARLLAARTLEEQRAFFDEIVAPFFDHRFIRWLTRQPVTVFSLGIPPSQHQVMHTESRGQIVEVFRQRLEKLVCAFPLEDNYFAWQAFGRTYDHANRRALPDYLRAEHHAMMQRTVGRVETHIESMIDCLRRQPADSLNSFSLLDAQDWMPPQVIEALWTEIARVGAPGSRIIFRTAGEISPLDTALPIDLMRRFNYEQDLSRHLHDLDRSAIYGMFHVYTLNN